MKKKETSKTKTLFEAIEYTIKGIIVNIRIDYVAKKISVIERNGSDKRFLFSGREVEYIDGWAKVLDAIKEATQDAKKRLEARIEEEEKEKAYYIDKMFNIADKKI